MDFGSFVLGAMAALGVLFGGFFLLVVGYGVATAMRIRKLYPEGLPRAVEKVLMRPMTPAQIREALPHTVNPTSVQSAILKLEHEGRVRRVANSDIGVWMFERVPVA